MLPAGVRYSLEERITVCSPLPPDLSAQERELIELIAGMPAPTVRKVTAQLGKKASSLLAGLMERDLLRPSVVRRGLAEQTLRQTACLTASPGQVQDYLSRQKAQRDKHARVLELLQGGGDVCRRAVLYGRGDAVGGVHARAARAD